MAFLNPLSGFLGSHSVPALKRKRSSASADQEAVEAKRQSLSGSIAPPISPTFSESLEASSMAVLKSDDTDEEDEQSEADPVLDKMRHQLAFHLNQQILVKHRELRMLQAEMAKCDISLEQMRRCHHNPYPGYAKCHVNVLDRKPVSRVGAENRIDYVRDSEDGPLVETENGYVIPHYMSGIQAPHGAYMAHYQRWLLPDESREPVVSAIPAPVAAPITGRQTRNSKASGISPVEIPAPVPDAPINRGHPLVLTNSQGEWVKLSCACEHRGHHLKNIQGFINHCRILHGQSGKFPEWDFKTHKAAADYCGDAEAVEDGDIPPTDEPQQDVKRGPRNMVPPPPLIQDAALPSPDLMSPTEVLPAQASGRMPPSRTTRIAQPTVHLQHPPTPRAPPRKEQTLVHPLNKAALTSREKVWQDHNDAVTYMVARTPTPRTATEVPFLPSVSTTLPESSLPYLSRLLQGRKQEQRRHDPSNLDELATECSQIVDIPEFEVDPEDMMDEDADEQAISSANASKGKHRPSAQTQPSRSANRRGHNARPSTGGIVIRTSNHARRPSDVDSDAGGSLPGLVSDEGEDDDDDDLEDEEERHGDARRKLSGIDVVAIGDGEVEDPLTSPSTATASKKGRKRRRV